VGLWEHHRQVFGYTLLAELPFQAGKALGDFDLRLDPVDLLIVDEYQDLNEADIKLIRLLAQKKGIRVLAIGDDDQSIYGFRLAAPPGIRRFGEEFGNCRDYALTISQRCGKNILAAATSLIEAAPSRPRKTSLTPRDGMHDGRYLYLQFSNEVAEVNGVADLIQSRIKEGVPPSEIAVLVRGQADLWAEQLVPALAAYGIAAMNVDWVENVLREDEVRRGLALIRLSLQPEDSLAWWTLLRTQRGTSEGFIDYIYLSVGSDETFGQTLQRLHPYFAGAPTAASVQAAAGLIMETRAMLKDIQSEGVALGETGWLGSSAAE
jgi:DNA helicase-2/ATP-dependent DNA helicase PcrA